MFMFMAVLEESFSGECGVSVVSINVIVPVKSILNLSRLSRFSYLPVCPFPKAPIPRHPTR